MAKKWYPVIDEWQNHGVDAHVLQIKRKKK